MQDPRAHFDNQSDDEQEDYDEEDYSNEVDDL